jgi:BirA family biotin operon repressor/biotin-[acetyl-CoA-carboxylase] ligase
MQLDPIAVAAGVRLEALGTTGSTNTEARARARLGERGPLWITALVQTEGRGRMDRAWMSPQGNLYASLLLTDPSPPERAPELTFVSVLALRDAIAIEAPAFAPLLRFKWPNDLLLAGKKCAGILIEGEVAMAGVVEPCGSLIVVIGIGANCAKHPSGILSGSTEPPLPLSSQKEAVLFPATDLRAHGADITPEQLFRRLSATMSRRIAQWDRGQGVSAILGDWLSAAHGVGEDIAVRNGGNEKQGRFAGLDQSGRLILELRGGTVEKISAGDVFPFSLRGGQRIPGGQG